MAKEFKPPKRFRLSVMRVTPGDAHPLPETIEFNREPSESKKFQRLLAQMQADPGSVYRVWPWAFEGCDPEAVLHEFGGKVGQGHRLRVVTVEWDGCDQFLVYCLPLEVAVDPVIMVK